MCRQGEALRTTLSIAQEVNCSVKLTVVAASSPASSTGMSVTSLRSAQRPTTRVQSAATEEEGLFLKILALVVLAMAT